MNQPVKILDTKPTSKLKLKLLPPREQKDITRIDIINFYKNLINIFYCEK